MADPAVGDTPAQRYRTPEAFRQALAARIADCAAEGGIAASEIRRHFTYDRLLSRLFIADPDRWVLKGATGLLARVPGRARYSLDVDLFGRTGVTTAVEALQRLGTSDTLGDYFTFDINARRAPSPHEDAASLTATAFLGEREFERFKIDLVVVSNMTAEPETVDPIQPVEVPGLSTARYRVYPLVDHIADKHAAMLDTYRGRPSTRYRDLVDLAIIAETQVVSADALRTALLSEYAFRGLPTPTAVTLPSPDWERGYAQAARQAAHLEHTTARGAAELVGRLINPVLAGEHHGTWDPTSSEWTDEPHAGTT